MAVQSTGVGCMDSPDFGRFSRTFGTRSCPPFIFAPSRRHGIITFHFRLSQHGKSPPVLSALPPVSLLSDVLGWLFIIMNARILLSPTWWQCRTTAATCRRRHLSASTNSPRSTTPPPNTSRRHAGIQMHPESIGQHILPGNVVSKHTLAVSTSISRRKTIRRDTVVVRCGFCRHRGRRGRRHP